MVGEWPSERVSDIANVTDFVANGSFESLRNKVTYRREPDYAILVRLVDHNAGWSGSFVYVDKASYDFLRKSTLDVGDIVVANVGANAGTVFRVPNLGTRMTLGPNAVLCRPKDENILRRDFLYYYLISESGQQSLHSILSGSAQPKFNKTDFRALSVPVPPPNEQRAIAHILGTLDDKIELNRRMNGTLETMARALFKSWFVDFDPARAKAEGRDPGLPKPLADLFPDSFVDSELGEIPKGWGVETLSDLASLNPESWSKETRPEVINYIDLSNVKRGSIDDVVGYTQQDAPSRAQRVLRSGDTIVGTVRPGNGSYAFINADGLTGSTGFAVLRPHRSEYAQFIYLAATSAENIEALAHLADGGAYPAVRPDVVIATPVIRPRDKVLARFSIFSDSLLARIAQNERESRTLAALRDTLLPKLIFGELRVKDAERIIGGGD